MDKYANKQRQFLFAETHFVVMEILVWKHKQSLCGLVVPEKLMYVYAYLARIMYQL